MRTASIGPILVVLALALAPTPSHADVLVHADGRRTQVSAPRADSKGNWTIELEGRRVAVQPGEIVAIVDGEGRETRIPHELRDLPWTPADDGRLTRFVGGREPDWQSAMVELVTPPRRAVLEKLQGLRADKRAETRARVIAALAGLRTKEGVRAAAEAVLSEADTRTRSNGASVLFSIVEIYRRSACDDLTKRGLADKSSAVRFAFAWLAPDDCAEAVPVLVKDGLSNSDHHLRESAALRLAAHGDASGEALLVAMLARDRVPGVDDADLAERLTVREHVAVCEALGRIGTKRARAALDTARNSKRPEVRAAAEAAWKRLPAAAPPA